MQVYVAYLGDDRLLRAYRGDGTLLATSDTAWPLQTWRYGGRQVRIELRAVLIAGFVPNVAFDEVSLSIQEQTNGGSGGSACW